jgi:hypothetical protein
MQVALVVVVGLILVLEVMAQIIKGLRGAQDLATVPRLVLVVVVVLAVQDRTLLALVALAVLVSLLP